jgi:hypothetical protein
MVSLNCSIRLCITSSMNSFLIALFSSSLFSVLYEICSFKAKKKPHWCVHSEASVARRRKNGVVHHQLYLVHSFFYSYRLLFPNVDTIVLLRRKTNMKNATTTPVVKPVVNAVSTPLVATVSAPVFTIESGVPMLPATRGKSRPEMYPFSKMAVNDSFFVPATTEHPEIWKRMAAVAANQTRKLSTVSATETRKTRTGKMVPLTTPTKVFVARQVTAGQRYTNDFVEMATGARVFRTK